MIKDFAEIFDQILGKSIVDAHEIYPEIRIVCESGQYYYGKLDYQNNRINVETENGVIVKVLGLY